MKKAVFWDVAPDRVFVKRRLGAQGGCSLADFLIFSSTLKMEAIRSSETSVNTISTRRHIPEGRFLQVIYYYYYYY
jgi:hypothetical protein